MHTYIHTHTPTHTHTINRVNILNCNLQSYRLLCYCLLPQQY